MAVEEEARPEERIRELKRQALQKKQEGNPAEALKLLEEARNLEFAAYASLEDYLEALTSMQAATPGTSNATLAKKVQQYAVYLKQNGDLEGAKLALLQSKQLQQHKLMAQQAQSLQSQETPSQEPLPPIATETITIAKSQASSTAPTPSNTKPKAYEAIQKDESEMEKLQPTGVSFSKTASLLPTKPALSPSSSPIQPKEQDPEPDDRKNINGEPNHQKESIDEEQELGNHNGEGTEEERELRTMTQEEEEAEDDEDLTATASVGFTDAEMMDLEMMKEFFAMQQQSPEMIMAPLPTLEDYQHKILESKQTALRFKQQGQTPKALQALQKSKRFQAVHDALQSLMASSTTLRDTDDDHQWLEDLSSEEHELIRELYAHPSRSSGHNTDPSIASPGAGTVLDLEDLDDMDAETLKDALALGMTLPPLDQVRARAEAQKTEAISCKQKGDLAAAKAALVLYKKMQEQVAKLEVLSEQMATASDPNTTVTSEPEVSSEALEALFAASEQSKTAAAAKPKVSEKPKPATSQELKQEAIRLRDAGRTAEATTVLKKYKEALQREAAAAEQAKIQRLVEGELLPQAKVARDQALLFQIYYVPLVHAGDGAAQVQAWTSYALECENAAATLKRLGSTAVTWKVGGRDNNSVVLRSFPLLEGGSPGSPASLLLQRAADPTDDRLECCLLRVTGLESHKSWPTLLRGGGEGGTKKNAASRVRAHVQIHLPASEEAMDQPLERWVDSTAVSSDPDAGDTTVVEFSPEPGEDFLFRLFPRNGSKFAKAVLRRMERRKIQITLYHTYCSQEDGKQQSKKKGLAGWFGSGQSNKTNPQNGNSSFDAEAKEGLTLLGKVVLETKDLLEHPCIAGGFPLIGAGKKEVGGCLHFCLRTGVPFSSDGTDSLSITAAAIDPTELEELNHMLLDELEACSDTTLGFEITPASAASHDPKGALGT